MDNDLSISSSQEDLSQDNLLSESSLSSENPTILAAELDEEAQLKLEVIQSLLEPCSRIEYGEKLRSAAEKLNCSVRTVQRLVKRWEQEGSSALMSSARSDLGKHRISEFWQSFILKAYKEGNRGSKCTKPKQIAVKVQNKAREIGDEQPPTYRTILRVLKPVMEREEKAKSIRSPGWRGSTLSLKTRTGEDLSVEHSNGIWQCDHTRADVLLVDKYGELLGRPWLTTVIDTYSRCIMGINLGFDAPSSQVVALALRHGIMPKKYDSEYKLNCEWGTYGKPRHLYCDGGKDFRSNHLKQIGSDLGFVCHLRNRPSEGGIVERPFRTLNDQLFSTLPGYTGSNVQERPKDAEKDACLTLRELDELIVRFICDRYNQSVDARMGDQTRFQRWDAGLPDLPELVEEEHLRVCLMKSSHRVVQRGGYLQFENLMFRGEHLAGYAGTKVSIRFDPNDITMVFVYHQENNRDVFLTRAYAQGLETEKLSYEEAKASSKRIRSAGKTLSNESILQEAAERDALLSAQKSRKQRQKEEQASVKSHDRPFSKPEVVEEVPISDNPEVESFPEVEAFEPIDFDKLRESW